MDAAHGLLSATTAAAVLGAMALAALVAIGIRRRRSPYWYPMVFWVAHATAFFWVNVAFRLWSGYERPTMLFSSWGVVIFLQAFVSMLALVMVKFRMDREQV